MLVLRDVTERPEAVELGVARLVGTETASIVGAVRELLTEHGAAYLFLGTPLLASNVLVVGARWWLLLRRLGVEALSPGYAMAGTSASVFVGQVTPGAIGVDAVRGWLCYARGVALRTIIMSLVTDRLLALVGLVGVSFVIGNSTGPGAASAGKSPYLRPSSRRARPLCFG